MNARWNLETEGGEIVPFASAADLLAFVAARMERNTDPEDDDE